MMGKIASVRRERQLSAVLFRRGQAGVGLQFHFVARGGEAAGGWWLAGFAQAGYFAGEPEART
jgi:hypothetical protein